MITCKSIETSLNAPSTCIIIIIIVIIIIIIIIIIILSIYLTILFTEVKLGNYYSSLTLR